MSIKNEDCGLINRTSGKTETTQVEIVTKWFQYCFLFCKRQCKTKRDISTIAKIYQILHIVPTMANGDNSQFSSSNCLMVPNDSSSWVVVVQLPRLVQHQLDRNTTLTMTTLMM